MHLSPNDLFAPDEMAQHRTMRHCPMCLQVVHTSDCPSGESEEPAVAPAEEQMVEPGLTPAIGQTDLWGERKDLE
jgi:hypothetical protein